MPTIRIRPLVVDDLAEIWSYIAEDSPNRADTFIDTIDRKFAEPTVADSILDRLLSNAHRLELKGPSLRRQKDQKNM